MKRKIIISEDGSSTIYVENLDEHYHSVFGARSESEHIFINKGLQYFEEKNHKRINILEIGMGTGLNIFLSLLHKKPSTQIKYQALEKFPLTEAEWKALNYTDAEGRFTQYFYAIHESEWNSWINIKHNFELFKINADLATFTPSPGIDLVYFDAFAPDVQPELWSAQNFNRIYTAMNKGAILVTYSVKGFVKRNLMESGFSLEKLPGPRGKRHMLRALK